MLVLESKFEEEGLSTNFRTCGLGNWFKFFLSPLLLCVILCQFLNLPSLKSSTENKDSNKCPLHCAICFRKGEQHEVPDQF